MNGAWQIVLQQDAFETFLSLRRRDRDHILKTMQKLVQNPEQNGDFVERDHSGREFQIKVAGPFHLAFWVDPWVKEVRVVRIQRLPAR